MRNNAPINHFPPTPFPPKRSPIYGEAHFYSQPGSQRGQVPGDTNQAADILVRDLFSHSTVLVSIGTNGGVGNGTSRSMATNMMSGVPVSGDVDLRDFVGETTV
jgi:hypothetical protein